MAGEFVSFYKSCQFDGLQLPIAHSTNMKECYAIMKLLLDKINYKTYEWSICDDFKVIEILLELQFGYTKHCCFLCPWDSRARDQQY